MKKLLSVLCALSLSATAMADAHEHGFVYSVFQEARGLDVASAEQILKTQEQGRAFLPGWNATVDRISGDFVDMYGPVAQVAGANNLEKAQLLMGSKLAAMGISAGDWYVTRNSNVGHAAFVDFAQKNRWS